MNKLFCHEFVRKCRKHLETEFSNAVERLWAISSTVDVNETMAEIYNIKVK